MVVKMIHMKRYINDIPYITGQYNFSLVWEINWGTWYNNKQPWPRHTHGFVHIFWTAVLQNLFTVLFWLGIIPLMLGRRGRGVTSPKKGSNTLEVTSYINNKTADLYGVLGLKQGRRPPNTIWHLCLPHSVGPCGMIQPIAVAMT